MGSAKLFCLVLAFLVIEPAIAQDVSILRSIRECLKSPMSTVCLKERALTLIDEAMVSEKPIKVLDYVDIVRNPSYQPNTTNLEVLPRDLKERNEKLNDMLLQKVDEFFQSRTVKFNLGSVFDEGKF